MITLNSTAIEFDLKNRSFKRLALDEFEDVIDVFNKDKIFWIHCNLNQPLDLHKLTKKLHLPEELIELCHHKENMPKLIESEEALILQIDCVTSTELKDNNLIETSDLILYLTPTFCFTAATETFPTLMEFINDSSKAIRYAKTPCFILFLLMDNVINEYAKVLLHYELLSEEMDARFRETQKNIYNEVITIKQQLMKSKRHVIAIRELLMRISGRKHPVVSLQCRKSLSLLANHSHLLVYEIDSIRDMLNSLLGQIENSLMQKLNKTMHVLTSFATLFMPLSLITGIYGMNFYIPETHWKYGYAFGLGLIITFACIIIYIFKKKKIF